MKEEDAFFLMSLSENHKGKNVRQIQIQKMIAEKKVNIFMLNILLNTFADNLGKQNKCCQGDRRGREDICYADLTTANKSTGASTTAATAAPLLQPTKSATTVAPLL